MRRDHLPTPAMCRMLDDCIDFLVVSGASRHQTLCRSAASAANSTKALRPFTVRPSCIHPLVNSASDVSHWSRKNNASHQTATENLGVGSSLASHCTHINTLQQHLHWGSYWCFGFQSLLQSIRIRTFTFGWDYQGETLLGTTLLVLRLSLFHSYPCTLRTKACCFTTALTGVTTQ